MQLLADGDAHDERSKNADENHFVVKEEEELSGGVVESEESHQKEDWAARSIKACSDLPPFSQAGCEGRTGNEAVRGRGAGNRVIGRTISLTRE